MGRQCIKVTTLHGFSIEQLERLIQETNTNYTRNVLLAVTMIYKGINTSDVIKTLNKSRPTIVSYIKNWNESPKSIIDNRGGNTPSRFTDEILENLKDVILNKIPRDFGFPQATWNSEILKVYIENTYGKKFSSSFIRRMLRSLGFSYKRGTYKITKADPELQGKFKKNVYLNVSFGETR